MLYILKVKKIKTFFIYIYVTSVHAKGEPRTDDHRTEIHLKILEESSSFGLVTEMLFRSIVDRGVCKRRYNGKNVNL